MKNQNRIKYGQKVIVDLPTMKNGKNTDYYTKWHNMFVRCYDPIYQKKYPTYIGCSVSSEWHTLSTFKEWYYSQPNYGKSDMTLDKDILNRENKIHSPQFCRLVPIRINSLLTDCKAARGTCPVGVYVDKRNGKYAAQFRNGNKLQFLGYFETPEEAFLVYKTYKEQLIKTVAEEYYNQNLIDEDIRNALLNWTINP